MAERWRPGVAGGCAGDARSGRLVGEGCTGGGGTRAEVASGDRRDRWSGARCEVRGKKGRRKLLTGEEGNRRSQGRRHGVDGEMAMTREKENTTTKRTTS